MNDTNKERTELIDLIAHHLHGTYHCTRVWHAWGIGTMSQDDFEDVCRSDTPAELADAILASLAANAPAAAPKAAPALPYHDGVNIENLQRACRAFGLRTDDSLEAFVSPDVHADHVNRLTRAVIKYVLTRPAQPAAPQGDGDMLRAHAEGRVTHINNGLCPDIIEGHDTRDPECPVCQALLENHAALPAPPQGAAKGATA